MYWGKFIKGYRPANLGGLLSGLLCLCLLTMVSAGKADAQTIYQYENNNIQAIPDNACPATVDRTFSVDRDYTVSDVDIGVLLDHTYRRDLRITLVAPSGTAVTLTDFQGGGANNLNVRFDDEATGGAISAHNQSDPLTPVYNSTKRPEEPLSTFDGEEARGTWTLKICDQQGIDTGSFRRANLYLTEAPPFADLSLTNSFGGLSSNTGRYTLSVTNASASELTATGVTVSNALPVGVNLLSTAGTGTYSGDVWTIGTGIAPGETVTMELDVIVVATTGTIAATAEILTSSAYDYDSTPGNSVASEDDQASVSFVAGIRLPGYVSPLTKICSIGNQLKFSWASPTSWSPSGSLSQAYNVAGLGQIDFAITGPPNGFINNTPSITTNYTGGGAAGTRSLYLFVNNDSESDIFTTVVSLPAAVPGLQFTIFDVDYADNAFTDKVTITGKYNGNTVLPRLSNGTANYIDGNSAIGDGASRTTDGYGNVVVSFDSPVSEITVIHSNHLPTTRNNPRNQAISIHDFTFCRPSTSLSVTKISSVISDPVNGTSNPKRIPDAVVQYCILISNSGGTVADQVVATDTLAGPYSYLPGTMRTGVNCGSANEPEDENAMGTDETPVGASIVGSTITATAEALDAASTMALIFQVTID